MPVTKGKVIFGFSSILVLLVATGVAYLWVALHWSYSSGDRAGYVQKFSHKGWIFKTWEGELAMVPLPGALPEKFAFSVRDDAIAKKINDTLGRKVVITYEQHKGLPPHVFGDTEYFVNNIKGVE